jgi:membrane-associated phospholipid phosphatase
VSPLALRRSLLLAFATGLGLPASHALAQPTSTTLEAAAAPEAAATPAAQAPTAAPAPTPVAPVVPVAPLVPNVLAPEDYHFQKGVTCPLCELTPQYPHGRSGLHWHSHWQPVGTRELVTIGALGAASLGLQLFWKPQTESHWNKAILFDNPVRDALRIDSADGRRRASTVSDVLFVWEIVHTSVVDPLLVAWYLRESPFVAWQMVVIDAQAYSMTILLNQLVKRLTARSRPWVGVDNCAQDSSGPECGQGGANVSFYSGHAAVTATSAGLMCAHHTQLSLYQSDVADTGMCAVAVLGTALTGALRIASDNHWATDVIVGHLTGYASGYLLPTLLYYKEFRATPHQHDNEPQFAAFPMVTGDSLGISVLGAF